MQRAAPSSPLSSPLFIRYARQPGTLFCAVMLGLWLGLVWPAAASFLAAPTGVYLALLQALSLPYIALAVYFGLQRLVATRTGWRPWLVLLAWALVATPLCALAGALLCDALGAGAGLNLADRRALAEPALAGVASSIDLFGSEPLAQPAPTRPSLAPHNLYRALADGALPSVVLAVLLFGAAVSAQRRTAAARIERLDNLLQAVLRALEVAIGILNTGLPLMAFMLAVTASAALAGPAGLLLGVLGAWLAAACLTCCVALALLCWRTGLPPWTVLTALREAITVSLCAPAGAAALPEFIDGLSTRLGCNRAAAELLMPVAPSFLRCGDAMFFAVLIVGVANVYGHSLGMRELGVIVLLACWVPRGAAGSGAMLWSGVLQASLGLPAGALVPVLASLEALCAGSRNLVSYLGAAVLVALAPDRDVARLDARPAAAAAAPVLLVLPRREAWLGIGLLAAGALAVFAAGVGTGLRRTLLTGL